MAGEILTKLALNNKIVEMRKTVRQARLHCINKLTREIRKLKIKKGSEEQIAKNLSKVDKLIKQMAVIKKINPDVVSKFALQNEKSFVQIISDANETIENKALSRLACHKSVQQKVSEFREKFPDWKKLLTLLLESLGEKYKNKKPNKPVSSKKKERNSNLAVKNERCDAEEEETVQARAKVSKSELRVKTRLASVKNSETRIIDESIAETELIPTPSSCSEDTDSESISDTDAPEIAADPFFITKDDKEYLSVSAKQAQVDEKISIDTKPMERLKPQKKAERVYPNRSHLKSKMNPNNVGFSNSTFAKRKGSDFTRQKHSSINDVSSTATSLHPSWEAKKKLSTVLQNSQFQGKKIKFDE